MSDEEHGVPTCPQCGCPFLTSMQHRVSGRWTAQCSACGHAWYLDDDTES